MICDGTLYGIRPFVACLPAWFRFAQCLRRYKDTRQAFPHLVNAGKYSTAFFVVVFSTLGKNSLIQKLAFHREGVVNYQLHVKFIFPPFYARTFFPFAVINGVFYLSSNSVMKPRMFTLSKLTSSHPL